MERSGEPPSIIDPVVIAGDSSGKSHPFYKEKWWGSEETHFNSQDKYCCKVLRFKRGGKTSLHSHVKKHETLLVVEGTLTLEYVVDTKVFVTKLEKGEAWVVSPGFPHKLSAEDGDVVIVEASTFDSPDDSVRIRI
jgi:mannose-6-phosphate isomerase-like protein (cupin superfamily)